MKKRYPLPRAAKLKSRKLIEQLFRGKVSFAVFPFRVYYAFTSTGEVPVQAGFGVSAKNFKKAVDRNRIKRLARESFRLQQEVLLPALDNQHLQLVLFFIYTGKDLPDQRFVTEKIRLTLHKLERLIHDTAPSNT